LVPGLTVPQIGFVSSSAATEGNNIARIIFAVGVIASASFSQDLGVPLQAHSRYVLQVDAGRAGLASVLASARIRVYAGDQVVADSHDPSVLTILDFPGDMDTYQLNFCSGANVPSENLRIELSASAVVSALSAVAFDHVRFERSAFDCPCNFNGDCYLNSQDFFDFLSAFFMQTERSDINRDGLYNSQDYFDFLTCFFGALPACQ
jgi:hypothetical protein